MTRRSRDAEADAGSAFWLRLLCGLGAVFAIFHGTATALGSGRGEAGLVVGALVVGATMCAERALFFTPLSTAGRTLGLGIPHSRGIVAAIAVGVLLLLVFPAYSRGTGKALEMYPRWWTLLAGLFAQAGIAEETLFRGYLFRRIRNGRSFWRAVAVSSAPFVAVHLVLFATMPRPVALAAVLLSVAISAPLAYLFELGGGTIWAPACVHFVIQGAVKLILIDGADPRFPIVWMAACAVIPFLVFLVRRPTVPRFA